MKRVLCLITGAAIGLCLTAQASDATKQTVTGVIAHPQQLAGSGGSEHMLVPDVDVVEDLVTQFGENPNYTPAPQGGIAEFISPCPVGPGQANCQDPDAANGYGSTGRAGGFRMHEDLRTGGSAINITSICVLGLYSPGSTDGNDNITLQYFADAGNVPGASIGGPFVQGTNLTVARVQTGATLFGAPEWQHRLTHANVNIGANTCYWVRIINDARTATNANRTWFWETSSGGNGRCISQTVNSGAFNLVTGDDLAICVEGVASLGDANSCVQLLTACSGTTQTGVRCTPQDASNAINSTTGVFATQDNFNPDVNGNITNICWWGAYQGSGCVPNPPTDSFTIIYYNHNPAINGPGTVLGGPFTGGQLTGFSRVQTGGVIAGVVNEFSYSVNHPAVAVTAGTCYWVEIRNTLPLNCNWFWEQGFDDGRAYVNASPSTSDLAFCINVDRRSTADACVALGDLCNQDPGNCHGVDPANALSSSPVAAIADDFRSDADGGDIEEICWWGGYQDAQGGGCGGNPVDNFIITYYNHNAVTGLPGSVLAGPFTQGGSLTVARQATGDLIAGIVTEFNYVGTHAPVALAPNTCYWVEITNSVTACTWFWEFGFGGNGRSIAGGIIENNDFAFCVDAGMNGNDEGQCVAQPTDLCLEDAGNCQARNIDNARSARVRPAPRTTSRPRAAAT
ncbi:MAG: hypothetical protein IPM64_12665 [Phycisphaerales bacterium]|nr:hypothetical protein [Phycisphaerales bacterium]